MLLCSLFLISIMHMCHCINIGHCICVQNRFSQNLHFTHVLLHESALETISYMLSYLIHNEITIVCSTYHAVGKFGENHEQSFSPCYIETSFTYKQRCDIINKLMDNVLHMFNCIIFTMTFLHFHT